jgi:light-regulated signal transduction histidine kinase (bacteriophytochrome)
VAAEQRLLEQTEELRRSNEELAQFAYAASHDLQEPLRMVSTYTQLLDKRFREALGPEARPLLDCVMLGAERMRALIADLLALAQIDSDPLQGRPVELAAALQRARADLAKAFADSGAVLEAGPLPTIPGVESHLARLFQNLLSNAIKFRAAEPTRIRVEAERAGEDWLLTVADNGIGLHPRYAERIFALFQRLHSRDDYPGTGIGLTTARKIVERHGGRIWVESAPGRGARFRFTLPARRRALPRPERERPAQST